MISYAANTTTAKTLAVLRSNGWRVLLAPKHPTIPEGFRFGIDNGAWHSFTSGKPFQEKPFLRLVERAGHYADFVVLPDIHQGGRRSLDLSVSWISRLCGVRRLLLPVQDGITESDVVPVLKAHSSVGLFLGGSDRWRSEYMYRWGVLACSSRRYYHVGRVNSARRIRLAAESGADSFDGSGPTLHPDRDVPILQAARVQPSLLVPSTCPTGF